MNLRERIERELRALHFDGTSCGDPQSPNACSNCYGPSPMSAAEIAEALAPVVEQYYRCRAGECPPNCCGT